jgi:hypothetical protein
LYDRDSTVKTTPIAHSLFFDKAMIGQGVACEDEMCGSAGLQLKSKTKQIGGKCGVGFPAAPGQPVDGLHGLQSQQIFRSKCHAQA